MTGSARFSYRKLKITGLVGILLGAKRSGKLASLTETLTDLGRTGFWLSQSLREKLLREAGE